MRKALLLTILVTVWGCEAKVEPPPATQSCESGDPLCGTHDQGTVDGDGGTPTGPFTTYAATDYVLGAYYFGTYSPTYNHRLAASQYHYGRSDPWAGIRDYHGDVGVPQNTDGWTPRAVPSGLQAYEFGQYKPALGYYDQDQVSTLYRHIVQARSHGIKYFNFYWYYRQDATAFNGVREVIDAALYHDPATGAMKGSFLAANDQIKAEAGSPTLKFMITVYANDGAGSDYSPLVRDGAVADEIVRRWVDYMSRYDYLKTRTGRPLIAFGHTVASDPTLVRDYISKLKLAAQQRGLLEPFVVMEHSLLVNEVPPDGGVPTSAVVDGYTCLNQGDLAANGRGNVWSYATWVNAFTSAYTDTRKPWLPCFMTDFNEKPRTRMEYNYDKSKVRYVDNWSKTLFGSGLSKFKTAIANARILASSAESEISGYGVIYAWNEWAEAALNLEPSAANSHWVLSEITSKFNLTAVAPSHQWCTSCTPSCASKACGASDGCGGTCCAGSGCTSVSCSTCKTPDSCGSACVNVTNGTTCIGGTCQNGTCTASCTPSCTGKTCGAANGCGGTCCAGSGCTSVSCSTCKTPDSCGSACVNVTNGTTCTGGTCQNGTCTTGCTPSCAGKTCGATNGCGGTCCAGSGCTSVSCPTCQTSNSCGSGCVTVTSGTACNGSYYCYAGACQSNGLGSATRLLCGQSRVSPDGRFTLTYQTDGNLVLYQSGVGAIWNSQTSGTSCGSTEMQADGNLVVYDASTVARWNSQTMGHAGAFLEVQSDGNVVVYSPSLTPLWSTGTSGR
jgi:hypothetical protein